MDFLDFRSQYIKMIKKIGKKYYQCLFFWEMTINRVNLKVERKILFCTFPGLFFDNEPQVRELGVPIVKIF